MKAKILFITLVVVLMSVLVYSQESVFIYSRYMYQTETSENTNVIESPTVVRIFGDVVKVTHGDETFLLAINPNTITTEYTENGEKVYIWKGNFASGNPCMVFLFVESGVFSIADINNKIRLHLIR